MIANVKLAGLTVVCAGVLGLAACETAPKSADDKTALMSQADGAMGSFKATDPTLNQLLSKSVGHAIFPSVGKAGFIAGAAFGRGEVFEGGKSIGWADITQGTVGLQVGAQSYDELIIFLTQDTLNRFKQNQFTFSANMSAVAIKPGVAGAADVSKGVAVFVRPTGGMMAEASVGGQRFKYEAK